jgi:uncharacterized membrane protein
MATDIFIIFYWWVITLLISVLTLPLIFWLFGKFWDKGWIFAKTASLIFISYAVFILGRTHIFPFYRETIFLVIFILAGLNIYWLNQNDNFKKIKKIFEENWQTFVWQEGIFLTMLVFWSIIRGFEPRIEGLEKFMDFGFVRSILRTKWFPPPDMWFAGEPINYYFFGHLIAAVLTKLSSLDPTVTYNLMIATIFAQAFVGTFSLASNLLFNITEGQGNKQTKRKKKNNILKRTIIGGLISAMLLTLGGNLHTVTYVLKRGAKNYWYPDATRFIGYEPDNPKDACIHEFPMYSFVVSDLHGHVNDIPIVLLFLAVLLSFGLVFQSVEKKFQVSKLGFRILMLAFLLATMYMSNSWDFPIYGIVFAIFTFLLVIRQFDNLTIANFFEAVKKTFLFGLATLVLAILFAMPFAVSFSPMTQGIKFVDANTLWWQFLVLWGFFWFIAISFWLFIVRQLRVAGYQFKIADFFVLATTIWATILIIIPEIIYVKDIYIHEHHRSNTMFKLVYQSFMMYSISAGYVFFRVKNTLKNKLLITVYLLLFTVGFFSHMVYPYFSIKGYYGDLKNYQGLYGMEFLENQYPDNYEAVLWMNKNISGQPVILEAVGDSYTMYNHFSAMTGLPTVQGWTVHEWLWRGGYDLPGQRAEEVNTIYQSNEEEAENLLNKYDVKYVIVGSLEREKYSELDEERFLYWGNPVFTSGETTVYQLD